MCVHVHGNFICAINAFTSVGGMVYVAHEWYKLNKACDQDSFVLD